VRAPVVVLSSSVLATRFHEPYVRYAVSTLAP